jgi:hypothetical protein
MTELDSSSLAAHRPQRGVLLKTSTTETWPIGLSIGKLLGQLCITCPPPGEQAQPDLLKHCKVGAPLRLPEWPQTTQLRRTCSGRRMTQMGHEGRFPPTRLSAGYGFRKGDDRRSAPQRARRAESRHSLGLPQTAAVNKADIRTHSSARTIVHDALLKACKDLWTYGQRTSIAPQLSSFCGLFGSIVIK